MFSPAFTLKPLLRAARSAAELCAAAQFILAALTLPACPDGASCAAASAAAVRALGPLAF